MYNLQFLNWLSYALYNTTGCGNTGTVPAESFESLLLTKSNHTPSIIKVDALDIIKVIVAN